MRKFIYVQDGIIAGVATVVDSPNVTVGQLPGYDLYEIDINQPAEPGWSVNIVDGKPIIVVPE